MTTEDADSLSRREAPSPRVDPTLDPIIFDALKVLGEVAVGSGLSAVVIQLKRRGFARHRNKAIRLTEELADELQLIKATFDELLQVLAQDTKDNDPQVLEFGQPIFLSADEFDHYAVAKDDLGRHVRKVEKVVLRIERLLLDMGIGEQSRPRLTSRTYCDRYAVSWGPHPCRAQNYSTSCAGPWTRPPSCCRASGVNSASIPSPRQPMPRALPLPFTAPCRRFE
jgi:hypothetical protein